MRFEIRYFFLEIGLSLGLAQSQEKIIQSQTSLNTFVSNGLACVTIQCMRNYIGKLYRTFLRGGGAPREALNRKIPAKPTSRSALFVRFCSTYGGKFIALEEFLE